MKTFTLLLSTTALLASCTGAIVTTELKKPKIDELFQVIINLTPEEGKELGGKLKDHYHQTPCTGKIRVCV